MNEKNKIIDKLFKKLLVNNYSKSTIIKLLNLNLKFKTFNGFLLYLYSLSNKKDTNDLKVEMCINIKSYLWYLFNKYNLYYSLDWIKPNETISDLEFSLLEFKQANNKMLHINNNDQFCLILNQNQYQEINDCCLNVLYEYDFKFNSILKSKQPIHIFINKNNESFKYLGIYYPLSNYYLISDYCQNQSIIFTNSLSNNINNKIYEIINELNNNAFVRFKNTIILWLNENNIKVNKNLENATDLNSFKYHLFNLILNYYKLLSSLLDKYQNLFNDDYTKQLLIPKISNVNNNELIQISNSINILFGYQIDYDYLHNIFIIVNEINDNDEYKIALFDSYINEPFQLKINQLILDTMNHKKVIYLFTKSAQGYQFIGYYYVYQLIKTNNQYCFKLHPIDFIHWLNHQQYLNDLIVDNNYLNAFNELNNNHLNEIETKNTNIQELNSFNKKYNWNKKEIITNINNNDYYQNQLNLYENYQLKLNFFINNILLKKFNDVIGHHWINIHNVAYDLLSKYPNNQQLINMAKLDFNELDFNQMKQYLKQLIRQ